MVAPEIVIVQWFEILVHGNDTGSGGVERDRFYRVALHRGILQSSARCLHQRAHVVRVTLGSVVGIVLLTDQRIVRRSAAQSPARAVENRHSYTKRSEIYASDNTHSRSLRMLIHAPTQVACGRLIHGWRYLCEIGRDMMLKATFANIAQQLLQLGDSNHARAAESIERIVREFTFPDVPANRPG